VKALAESIPSVLVLILLMILGWIGVGLIMRLIVFLFCVGYGCS